jgi:NAD(P)-dependent dehydrogenase (short-subunit alcohol dehydrogenase family)
MTAESTLFSLAGRTAVVTGATGLLGQAHCRALAEAGATVVVTDLEIDACTSLARELGPCAYGVVADVTDKESLRALRTRILQMSDRIDILVNNAAIDDKFESPAAAFEESRFENYALESWQKSLCVNVTGVFLCCQVLGQVMARQGGGSIINIASTYGVVGPDQSLYLDEAGKQRFCKSAVYPTTKGAVIAFTKFLAAYWGHRGVRVNALSPGGVENGQDGIFTAKYAKRTPLRRLARPSEYMGALLFLASDASAYMTGANLIVDGGFTAW